MAEIGNNPASPDMDYSESIENVTKGLRVTMTEAADGAASIWFYGNTFTGSNVLAAIYEDGSNPNLVVDHASAYTTVATNQWHEIPLDTTVLSNGTTYILCLHDSGAAALVSENNGASNTDSWRDFYSNFVTGGAWDDPATGGWNPGSFTTDLAIYLEYTPAVAAIYPEILTSNQMKHTPKIQVVNY